MTRLQRIGLIASVALVFSALGGYLAVTMMPNNDGETLYSSLVGGPFQLTSHTGETVTHEDLRGKPFAMFFGFTHCPDVCPTSMYELSTLIEKLGPDADKMRYVFVSVDPERDTPELLKDYMSHFDKRLVALVGTPAQTKAIAQAYRVVYEKVETSGGYTLNHTATIYVMDEKGRLANTLAYGENMDTRLQKLRRVIERSGQNVTG